MLRWLLVPVAVSQHACIGGRVKVSEIGRRQPVKTSRSRPGVQGLPMAAFQPRTVLRSVECSDGIDRLMALDHNQAQLIITHMERTLDATLLHLTKERLVHNFPSQINACLDALTEDQIWWRPNEQANAVGNLVLHLSGSNRYYLEHVIAGKDDRRDRDAEFAARGSVTKTKLRRTWDEVTRVSEAVLSTLDPSTLMTTTDRTGKATTYAQVLLHVSVHNATHLGQIVWITKMLQPGAILWIDPSSSKETQLIFA